MKKVKIPKIKKIGEKVCVSGAGVGWGEGGGLNISG